MRLTVKPADGVAEDAEDQTVNIVQANLTLTGDQLAGKLRYLYYPIQFYGKPRPMQIRGHFLAVKFENLPPAPYKTVVVGNKLQEDLYLIEVKEDSPYVLLPYDDLVYGTNLTVTAKCLLNGEVVSERRFSLKVNDIQLDDSIKLTAWPDADLDFTPGTALPLHVAAEGDGLTYKWQAKNSPDQQSWSNTSISGNDTDTLNVSPTAAYDGRKYRCMISADADNYIYTNATTIHNAGA